MIPALLFLRQRLLSETAPDSYRHALSDVYLRQVWAQEGYCCGGYYLLAATEGALYEEIEGETLSRNPNLDEEDDYEHKGASKAGNRHGVAN